jgi:hypothetical protein
MAAYFGLVLTESVRLAKRIGVAKFVTVPFVFMAIHTGLGTGQIVEWIVGERKLKNRVPGFFPSHKTADDEHVQVPAASTTPQEIGTT